MTGWFAHDHGGPSDVEKARYRWRGDAEVRAVIGGLVPDRACPDLVPARCSAWMDACVVM